MIESNYRHLDGLTLDPTNRVPLIVPTVTTPQPRPLTQNEPVISPTLPQVEDYSTCNFLLDLFSSNSI